MTAVADIDNICYWSLTSGTKQAGATYLVPATFPLCRPSKEPRVWITIGLCEGCSGQQL
jgi:hypothetical protein